MRSFFGARLVEVARHKALYVGDLADTRIAAKDLQIDRWKMVIGVGLKLCLKVHQRLHRYGIVHRRSTGRELSSRNVSKQKGAAVRRDPFTELLCASIYLLPL